MDCLLRGLCYELGELPLPDRCLRQSKQLRSRTWLDIRGDDRKCFPAREECWRGSGNGARSTGFGRSRVTPWEQTVWRSTEGGRAPVVGVKERNASPKIAESREPGRTPKSLVPLGLLGLAGPEEVVANSVPRPARNRRFHMRWEDVHGLRALLCEERGGRCVRQTKQDIEAGQAGPLRRGAPDLRVGTTGMFGPKTNAKCES